VTNVIELGAQALIRYLPELELLRLVCGSAENTDRIEEGLRAVIRETGLDKNPEFSFELSVFPEIGYQEQNTKLNPEKINTFSDRLEQLYGDSIWWIHNYQLGKNTLFTAAVLNIAAENPERKMLFHIHDFPECARFDNLNKLRSAGIENPYPVSDNIAYSLINSRDLKLLNDAGLPAGHLFLLNNPVDTSVKDLHPAPVIKGDRIKRFYNYFAGTFPAADPEGKTIFYPVRSIRRKNILEAGLICAAAAEPANLVVGLPGTSGREQAYSQVCGQCFRDGLIPGVWGSGIHDSVDIPSFKDMLALSDLIISSSVQEGFGYLFINAVQLGTPLLARYLDILDGIRGVFPSGSSFFYEDLNIPADEAWLSSLKKSYLKKLDSLSSTISTDAVKQISMITDQIGKNGTIEFSYLPVDLQIKVLQQLKESTEYKSEIRELNKSIFVHFSRMLVTGKINQKSILDEFSLRSHAGTVKRILSAFETPENSTEYWKSEQQKQTVQQNLLDKFAHIDYMRLIYDYK